MATQLAAAARQSLEAISQGQSQRDLISSAEHKRKFLETFQRWDILFKRKDGRSVEAEKWLIAEYYASLKFLSAEGFDVLTDSLKETCIFFPTIKECLDLTKPADKYDWGHPFRGRPAHLFQPYSGHAAIQAERRLEIEDQTGGDG